MHFPKKMRYVPLLIIPVVCLAWGGNKYYLNTRIPTSHLPAHHGSRYYWNAVDSVNNHAPFGPGDTIFIARGCTCTTGTPARRGAFYGVLSPKGSGNRSGRITITAYTDPNYRNAALPVINARARDSTAGILLYDQQYWTIKNMEVKNAGASLLHDTTPGWRWGILVYSDTNATLHNISIIGNTVDSVYGSCYQPKSPAWPPDVFTTGGILIWASGGVLGGAHEPTNAILDRPYGSNIGKIGTPLMENIVISGNSVRNIWGGGIRFYGAGGDKSLWNTGWNNLCTRVRIHKNSIVHTGGQGILVGGTNNDIVDSNVIDGAGKYGLRLNDTGGFVDAGIQVYRHKNGIVEYNEVDSTHLITGDGQGIDVDGSISGRTIVQYNYCHDNGGGFLQNSILRDDPDSTNDGLIVRYNISRNDGLGYVNHLYRGDNWFAHLYYENGRGNSHVYNNTFYNRDGGGFLMEQGAKPDTFENNIFVGSDASWGETNRMSKTGNVYVNNWYYFNGDANYSSLTNSQLQLMNTDNLLPISDTKKYGGQSLQPDGANPHLAGQYAGGQGYTAPLDFKVSQASGCHGTGVHIPHIGIQDYFGNSTDTSKSIGADEEEPGVSKVHSFRFFGRK